MSVIQGPSRPAPPMARRNANIEPFRTMELLKQARVLEQQGADILHMSIGEPDFTAPPPVVEALVRAARSAQTAYTPALGVEALREAIAAHYARDHGVRVDPSRIVVTAGASAALTLACAALVNPRDRVLMTDPGYPCNRHFVAAYDGLPAALPVGPGSRYQLSAAQVEAHWDADTRGVLLASPANPTGTSIAPDELERIVNVVRARGGFTIVDEIYLGLSYDGPGRSALALGDDLIVSSSFSKYFHMTGWRLGWLVVPPHCVHDFEKLSQNLFICASALAQHAALACFEPDSLVEFARRKDEFRRRRDFIVPALRALDFGIPCEPDGAFYVYANTTAHHADSAALAQSLLRRAHVGVVPGNDFGVHEAAQHVRFSYASPVERLAEGMERLRRWIEAGRPV